MEKVMEGIKILEQMPIKDYTTLSGILTGLGLSIAIISIFIFISKNEDTVVYLKDKGTKIFLFWFILGLGLAIFSVIRFPWFYVETGRYRYKCTFEDDIPANDISANFNIIKVKDDVWTIEDK